MSGTAGTELDWQAWHADYERPESALSRRLALVQSQLAAALDRQPRGPVRAVSICAGQGHDVIGVLARHPRAADVSALLVELDRDNVARANEAARAAGLGDRVRAVAADASLSDAYAGAVPAQVILVCGVLGNISLPDIERLAGHLPELAAPGAIAIWTRHRNPPDAVPVVQAAMERAGFEQLAFADAPPYGVGAHRLVAPPRPLPAGQRMFDFIGPGALWPHLPEQRRAAMSALFRPDCSLAELVEAVRAIPLGLPDQDSDETMLREARGTPVAKHRFLATVLEARFPQLRPVIVHRLYRLTPAVAEWVYGPGPAAVLPPDGIPDVHRFLHVELGAGEVELDATLQGEPWDGRRGLAAVCGPGEDVLAGREPDAELARLLSERCVHPARDAWTAALRQLAAAHA